MCKIETRKGLTQEYGVDYEERERRGAKIRGFLLLVN